MHVCLPHTSTHAALIIEANTDKHKHPHKLNRTECNHTTDHINITMCAQFLYIPIHYYHSSLLRITQHSQLRVTFSDGPTHYNMYAMHAALSHTTP